MVDIEVFGLPADSVRKGVHKTRYQQGPHPKWENINEEFLIEKVSVSCIQVSHVILAKLTSVTMHCPDMI